MNNILDKIGRLVRDPSIQIDTTGFIFAILVSVIVSLIISILYQIFYENRATGSQIHRSFLLIGPSITALFIAIQFSLPLSLGLLGALSFIRFRTPIKEPEEAGFIMLLISTSVVCATFQFLLLFVVLFFALGSLCLQRFLPRLLRSKRKDGVLLVTFSGDTGADAKDQILKSLAARLPNGRIQSVSYGDNLTTMHFSFTSLDSASLDNLHTELNQMVPIQKLNIFFNSQGSLF